MYVHRRYLLRSFEKISCYVNGKGKQRKLSSYAMKVDEFTLKSSIPDVTIPQVGLFEKLWVHSSLFNDKVALVSAETKKSYTYAQLQKFISVFATSVLKKLDLQSNDMVAIVLPNCPEFPVVSLGALQAGCIVTTINPAYTSYELFHQFKLTKPKVVVTIPHIYNTVEKALNAVEIQAKIVFVDNPASAVPEGVVRYSEIAESGEPDYSLLDKVVKTHDDVAIIPFSSGTTGLAKGVQITYKNLLASLEIMMHNRMSLASLPDGSHQDMLQCVLPFFHIYGLVITLMGHLAMGCKLVTLSSFQPQLYLDILKNERNTLLYTVPPLLTLLGKNPAVTKDYFRHLKYSFCGAAPLSAHDVEELLEKFNPQAQFLQGYAMTETTSIGAWTYKDSGNRFFGSCGDPCVNFDLRFADPDTGNLVPLGQPGEVLLRSPCVMKGYYQNEEANKASITSDGFYKTGDLGIYDLEKGLYVLDRFKELIKVKGLQVAPAELEGLLRSHPSVLDAGVIGIPHAFHGEVPKAYVVLNKAKPATEEELKDFVSGKVSSFKKIHEFMFVDAIPKTASGKILRKELRKL